MTTRPVPDLTPVTTQEICRAAQQAGIKQVVLFGSRARGDATEASDIDLAVRGGDHRLFDYLLSEKAHLPAQYHLVRLNGTEGDDIARSVGREGIVLYDSRLFLRRLEDFRRQLAVLRSFRPEMAYGEPFYRMGVIGQFQLTFEMAWKALKEVMIRHGVDAARSGSPREIIRSAGQHAFVNNPSVWHAMLDHRNATGHVYDEQAADDLVALIEQRYLAVFEQLLVQLDERMQKLAEDET